MILRPFRRGPERRSIALLYGAIVAQARSPAFYADYGVPDTVEGRFDLIVLHLVLLLRRLGQIEAGRGSEFGQRLFDRFCRDLDDNLREMGVGDLAVPKRMRRFAEAFYGRQAAYLAALAGSEERDFENALARNIFQGQGAADRVSRLAGYARATIRELDAQPDSDLVRGEVEFPSVEAVTDVRE